MKRWVVYQGVVTGLERGSLKSLNGDDDVKSILGMMVRRCVGGADESEL